MSYFANSKPSTCPGCQSTCIVSIAYGYPAPGLLESAERGEVVLGGCCNMEFGPSWQCRDCSIVIYMNDPSE